MTHAALKDLLPCPFCGAKPTLADIRADEAQGTKWGGVICPGCGVAGPEVRTGYEPVACWAEDAAEEWNRRAALSAVEGEAVPVDIFATSAAVKKAMDDIRTAPPPQQAAERSALLALAGRIEAWAREPFVNLTEMRRMDVDKFVADLRALATQPQQAGGDARLLALANKWDADARSVHETYGPKRDNPGEIGEMARVLCSQAYTRQACAEELLRLSTPPQPEAGGGEKVREFFPKISAGIGMVKMAAMRGDCEAVLRAAEIMSIACDTYCATTPASGGEHG